MRRETKKPFDGGDVVRVRPIVCMSIIHNIGGELSPSRFLVFLWITMRGILNDRGWCHVVAKFRMLRSLVVFFLVTSFPESRDSKGKHASSGFYIWFLKIGHSHERHGRLLKSRLSSKLSLYQGLYLGKEGGGFIREG
jgi:hypothetical protein